MGNVLEKTIDEKLLEACEKINLEQVKKSLVIGADPCHMFYWKDITALHHSVMYKNDSTDILQAILSSKGSIKNINVTNSNGMTPLLTACEKGNVKCAKLLVDHASDITARNKNGDGVLHLFVESGKVDLVEECLNWNVVYVNQRGIRNKTALMFACELGFVDIVRVILAAGADVTLQGTSGHLAAWYAREKNNIMELFQQHLETQIQTPTPLPAGQSETSFSSSSVAKSNMSALKTVIQTEFPDFDEQRINSILKTIQDSGVDFEDLQPKRIILLKE